MTCMKNAVLEGIAQKSHLHPKNQQRIITNPPTNISATAWLITKYMLRWRRLRFLMYTMISRAFNATIATASMPNIVSQAMHSDGVSSAEDKVVFCCWEWLAICKEKENGAVTIDEIKWATFVMHLQISDFVSWNISIKRVPRLSKRSTETRALTAANCVHVWTAYCEMTTELDQ